MLIASVVLADRSDRFQIKVALYHLLWGGCGGRGKGYKSRATGKEGYVAVTQRAALERDWDSKMVG